MTEDIFIGSPISFDLAFDWQSGTYGQNYRGWSVTGQYWNEVSPEGEEFFKI
jgi:hypothetical protein